MKLTLQNIYFFTMILYLQHNSEIAILHISSKNVAAQSSDVVVTSVKCRHMLFARNYTIGWKKSWVLYY